MEFFCWAPRKSILPKTRKWCRNCSLIDPQLTSQSLDSHLSSISFTTMKKYKILASIWKTCFWLIAMFIVDACQGEILFWGRTTKKGRRSSSPMHPLGYDEKHSTSHFLQRRVRFPDLIKFGIVPLAPSISFSLKASRLGRGPANARYRSQPASKTELNQNDQY